MTFPAEELLLLRDIRDTDTKLEVDGTLLSKYLSILVMKPDNSPVSLQVADRP